MLNKKQLRAEIKQRRRNLTLKEIEDFSIQISNLIINLPIWKYSFYHIFLSIKSLNEVNTEPLLAILLGKDKNIAISKTNFEARTMSHILLQDNTVLKLNPQNIPEPINGVEISSKQIEVVFVPLMAFDKLGNRIGYGKGFYDIFLKRCSKNTLKIGLSFFEAENFIIENNPHDVPLDYCITPKQVYFF
ncbi:MAG: 5-formyltetrahydrofolate cyclo-ligase [Flavobacteriaceae bacterium]|nr:5-formyltetrahydrofolate cyclo-ligase [Flavobacteriaceae bacterium]